MELIASLAGLLNVYLAARDSIWNWFFGIITVSLYFIIFFQVKLYADMSLQAIFFCLQFYGLYQWLYGGKEKTELWVTKASYSILIKASLASLGLFVFFVFILTHFTDSTTYYTDAFITSLSLVAQWMLSKRWLENWCLWIIVDIVSIAMYFNKHLFLTSGLYAVFLVIAALGYWHWYKKSLHVQIA